MKLDVNDFEVITNRLREVYLQYAIDAGGKKILCLHLQDDRVTKCTISKSKIKQGQFMYAPRSVLSQVTLSAHQRICLSKKPCSIAREIIVSMFHLLTTEGNAVQPDSCAPKKEAISPHDSKTSQAGAAANG